LFPPSAGSILPLSLRGEDQGTGEGGREIQTLSLFILDCGSCESLGTVSGTVCFISLLPVCYYFFCFFLLVLSFDLHAKTFPLSAFSM
jgi:hypothetical protein